MMFKIILKLYPLIQIVNIKNIISNMRIRFLSEDIRFQSVETSFLQMGSRKI